MALSLEDIKKPISRELAQFEIHFKESMKSDVALLDKITYYIIRSKGKQMRPMFVFLSAKMFGDINDASYTGAAMIELLHTATLVHDDIVDDSNERRGFFSINALWKNKIAVLVGDYLFSRGLSIALETGQYQHLHIISSAVKAMAEGELMQMEKARRLDIEESIYFDIIQKKTASLIAAACSIGATSTSGDKEVIERMRLLGETIGICFQIKDDLFDYGTRDVGKPRGIDIKEKKMTLPLIYALSNCSKEEKRRIINIVKNESKNDAKVKEVIEFVQEGGGLKFAIGKMEEYRQKAFDLLNSFPATEASAMLKNLIEFTVSREK